MKHGRFYGLRTGAPRPPVTKPPPFQTLIEIENGRFYGPLRGTPPVAKRPLSRTLIATENGRFYGSRTDIHPLSPGNVVPLQQNIHCLTASAEV